MKIIQTGSIAFDYLMRFPGHFKDVILPEHLEKISLSFLVDDMVKHDGGVGANIAYTMALLGSKPLLYSAAGQDFPDFGRRLQAVGVDTSGVKIIRDKFTASFFANTDLDSNQISSFYTGAMAASAEMPLAESGCAAGDYVVVSPTDPGAMSRYIDEAKELGARMIFDPGQQTIRMDTDTMRRGIQNCYAFFANEYEFELMQQSLGLSEREVLEAPEFAVITLGKHGARVFSHGEEFITPIIEEAPVVDPTGVGDAFRAGFLHAYLAGRSLRHCAEMGTTTAALCIGQNGTQNHRFTWEEFKAYFRRYFDDQGELDNY
jgi:adenosine kinase